MIYRKQDFVEGKVQKEEKAERQETKMEEECCLLKKKSGRKRESIRNVDKAKGRNQRWVGEERRKTERRKESRQQEREKRKEKIMSVRKRVIK